MDDYRDTIIFSNQKNLLTYTSIIKALQPINIKALRFSIPEIFIFQQGEIELFITQKRTNLIGQYKMIKNIPISKIKALLSKNGCICKYIDDNVQILNDAELNILVNKMRNEQIWKDLQYIQSLHLQDYRVLYVSDLDDNTDLFRRAYIQIGILTKDIVQASEQYITDEMEDQYERQLNQEQLCKFYTYKIIHYLEKVRKIKITHGQFKWSIEKLSIYHFIECCYVNFINIENQLQKQATKKLQLNEFINDEIVHHYTSILTKEYEKKKIDLGFNENQFKITKDKETEKVFKEIHQGSSITYNQLFKDINSYSQYEGTLLKYLRQRHTIKCIRPRVQTVIVANNNSPTKTMMMIRPKTTTQQLQSRTPSYKQYKQKTAQRTLPYLLQF